MKKHQGHYFRCVVDDHPLGYKKKSKWTNSSVLTKTTHRNMGVNSEICFEAPEISMSTDITLDAVVSVVTVTKLTKVEVSGNCYCPGKDGANTGSAL